MSDADFPELENQLQTEELSTSQRGSPLSVELPPNPDILCEVRLRASDRNVPFQQLANIVVQDPIITLEMIRVANALFFAQDRPSILHTRTAIVRLGSQNITELFNRLHKRPVPNNPAVMETFEDLRIEAQKVGFISRIIASLSSRELADVVQTAGLLVNIGHMIACIYLEEEYVELSQNLARASLVYRLSSEYKLDITSTQLSYLRMNGLPQSLFYALDRSLVCKTPGQSTMRFVVQSAQELVLAYEQDKWDKYKYKDSLPSLSSLRLLKINDAQYASIMQCVETYLSGGEEQELEVAEEEQKESEEEEPASSVEDPPDMEMSSLDDNNQADDEYLSQIALPSFVENDESTDEYLANLERDSELDDFNSSPLDDDECPSYTYITSIPEFKDIFYVESPYGEDEEEEASMPLNEQGQEVLSSLQQLCDSCKTTEDLLRQLLELLISDNLFRRAALIIISTSRRFALIHRAAGENLADNPTIELDDPISPLAMCLTKIKSFNANSGGISDVLSPFGISAYAISPIRARHDTPVVLYADCGEEESISFERRKVFRRVVGLLNKTLPNLPGGLPKV